MEAPQTAFSQWDLRVGRVLRAEPNERARKPAYKLWIDFGPLGTLQSSAQLCDRYAPEDLVGRLIVAVTNFPPKNIAGFESQVLVLGVPDADARVVLLGVDAEVPLGGKVY